MKISNQELIELSTKIEREGKTFYKELANHVPDPEVKDFLLLMSREEAQHEIEFKKMLDAKGQKHYGWEENKSLRQLVNTYYQTDIFPRLDEIFDQVPKF
ncbi:MAG: hypothetical protein GWM98_20155, partial [Nitrospinaceae bacterium]|nr:hypothetical protein [Nitrospinaceae bacterium]NIR56366.1 hypothetical protein [Nitrospinaceae bacterium]NIS86828.1 hypothetical protein [Nitrospinaceae bacterium]NIT83664.1 hypothetical protein [Nitrospinaceae bacterium]NIU45862.1 hypothetical protein [Nitrospinaceae bacterium]